MRSLKLATLAAVALLVLCTGLAAQQDAVPRLAPQNQGFVDFIEGPTVQVQSLDDDGISPGLIPEPVKPVFGPKSGPVVLGVLGALPTSYDIRPFNKLTPIRDQGPCGSCWSFASIGSLESSLRSLESWDFAEGNLKNLHGFDISCCSGGNRTMATAYVVRWGGPIAEVDDPYNPSSCYSPAGLSPKKHVQKVVFLPTRTGPLDNDALKQAVMTYGAIYTTYYHSNSYYKSSTRGYYYTGGGSANHAVCIVGWDDSFAATSFLTPPPGNGAFLIRNSWGPYWGDGGYFWMSYYDALLGRSENAAFTADSAANYDTIYQYDTLGWISSTGYGSNTAWYANVFTAVSNTQVQAAAAYFPAQNCSYQLYVYVNPTSGPIGGAPAASKSGTLTEAGFQTIALDSGVGVSAGQKFSVVIRVTAPGSSYPIPIERPYSGYSSAATAGPGQSYISGNGASWTDLAGYYANANCCLKAYAKGAGAPTPGALSVTPSSGLSASGSVGGPFSPSSQAYTLTNTGGQSIDWTAARSQAWVSLSSPGGTLAPGASGQVTVSVNAGAGILTAGSYTDTVSFTNTTNGAGSAARGVSLTVTQSVPGSLSVTPSVGLAATGPVGGPFSPSSQTYTLRNDGQQSINWTAAKTQAWTSLSSTAGTLAPGASATVAVSTNSVANSLAAGSYADSVTFANTTNGTGSTTRAVSLVVSSAPPPPPPPPAGDYSVGPTTFSWINPAEHTKLSLGNNSATYAIAVPFGFDFYGTTYTRIYVSSNGMVGFASSGMTSYGNSSIPRTYQPNGMLCGYWDDLDPAMGGGVTMGMVGTAPNRKVVVTWLDVPHHSMLLARLSFQIVICESTNDIVFQYLNVSPTYAYGGGRAATIGIENQNGTKGCQWSFNTASVGNNSALRFTRANP